MSKPGFHVLQGAKQQSGQTRSRQGIKTAETLPRLLKETAFHRHVVVPLRAQNANTSLAKSSGVPRAHLEENRRQRSIFLNDFPGFCALDVAFLAGSACRCRLCSPICLRPPSFYLGCVCSTSGQWHPDLAERRSRSGRNAGAVSISVDVLFCPSPSQRIVFLLLLFGFH